MMPFGIIKRVIGGEMKLVLTSVIIGAVIGAIIWDQHGEAIKAWAGEHLSCPFHEEQSNAAKPAEAASN